MLAHCLLVHLNRTETLFMLLVMCAFLNTHFVTLGKTESVEHVICQSQKYSAERDIRRFRPLRIYLILNQGVCVFEYLVENWLINRIYFSNKLIYLF